MSDRTEFFRKFPLVVYNDSPAVNITKRVDFNTQTKSFLTAFYNFNIDAGERIETVSYDYYDDVDLDWLIYLANDIVDPYHGVALNYEDFENSIIKKYKSIRLAKRKTFCYRNNYRGDISSLSTDAYAALTGDRKKYWRPILNVYGVVGYDRNEDELYASTNQIISYEYTSETSNVFTVGELVDISATGKTGNATVASSNNTHVILQHIEGDWSIMSSNFDVVGDESENTIEFKYDSYTLLKDVIPANEQIYFSKYSYYDYESEINDNKREIYLVDQSYSDKLNRQLDDLMK